MIRQYRRSGWFLGLPPTPNEKPKHRRRRMSQNFSLHENYRDEELIQGGSDRAFGCTVGSILMAIGLTKVSVAGALSWVAGVLLGVGAVLLLLGIVAPSRLSP